MFRIQILEHDSHVKADPTEELPSANSFPVFTLVQNRLPTAARRPSDCTCKRTAGISASAPLPCSAAPPLFYALFCNFTELALRRFERQVNQIPYAATCHRTQRLSTVTDSREHQARNSFIYTHFKLFARRCVIIASDIALSTAEYVTDTSGSSVQIVAPVVDLTGEATASSGGPPSHASAHSAPVVSVCSSFGRDRDSPPAASIHDAISVQSSHPSSAHGQSSSDDEETAQARPLHSMA